VKIRELNGGLDGFENKVHTSGEEFVVLSKAFQVIDPGKQCGEEMEMSGLKFLYDNVESLNTHILQASLT
jgi:hypothetical protein